MSDCPMCGMNCGDTCYRPALDTVSQIHEKLGNEIEHWKGHVGDMRRERDMAIWAREQFEEENNKLKQAIKDVQQAHKLDTVPILLEHRLEDLFEMVE